MFTSDNRVPKEPLAKTGFAYLLISLFCALFGGVYEYFSHGVYSAYMLLSFIFPLAGGALPFISLALIGYRKLPGRFALNLYHSGIATVTVGSIMEGVLAIYGTTNDLLRFYWYAGFALLVSAITFYIFSSTVRKNYL